MTAVVRPVLAALALALTLAAARAEVPGGPADGSAPAKPEIVDLGGGRYRVGAVEIDKTASRFTVPGRVLRTEPPLEFLAVAKDGRKGYEAMLELDATAFEFNLACLLIGLDGERAQGRPTFHFDPQPVSGDGVALDLRWSGGDGERTLAAEALLADGGQAVAGEWVYTGSEFTEGGAYLAHIDGTLIGLVHDPSSVIEHRSGLGINTYGSITATREAPPAETRVVLGVRRLATADVEAEEVEAEEVEAEEVE